jgi:hypothetical protein
MLPVLFCLMSQSVALTFILGVKGASPQKVYTIAQDPLFAQGVPAYSDVLFSSRWDSSSNNLSAMAAFGATRSVWTYTTNSQYISAAKEIVSDFQCAVLPHVFAATPDAQCLDLNGDPVALPWLRTDPPKVAAGDVSTKAFKNLWLERARAGIDAGCDSIHQDDVRLTAGCVQYGGSFSAESMAAFRAYLTANLTPAELSNLGITNSPTFDYAQHLRDIGAPVGDAFGSWNPGGSEEDLKNLFYAFQESAVRDFYEEVFSALEVYAGTTLVFSANNAAPEFWYYDYFDYMIGELHRHEQDPLSVFGQINASRNFAKLQGFVFIPTDDAEKDRRTISLIYGAGGLPVAPWDVWMGPDAPRYYGDPDDYADLYEFVRDHAVYFDGYEDAAVAGRMGPCLDQVWFDPAPVGGQNPRTVISHAMRSDFPDVSAGAEFVINGQSYTTAYASVAGYLYLDGNQTDLFAVGDSLTAISNNTTSFVIFDQFVIDARYVLGEEPVVVTNLGVMAFVRAMPGNSSAPVVIHLVDYLNNGAFDITLHPACFFDSDLKITLLRPNAEPVTAQYQNHNTIHVNIPRLDTLESGLDSWGVLVIEPQ